MLTNLDQVAECLNKLGWPTEMRKTADDDGGDASAAGTEGHTGAPQYSVTLLGKGDLDQPRCLLGELSQGLLGQVTDAPFRTLQLTLVYEPAVHQSQVLETARLLLVLNRAIELPGLYLGEQERRVYHRVGLPVGKAGLDPEALVATVESMDVVADMFAGPIQDVAMRRQSVAEVVEAAVQG